jgi:hypothetical protein
VYGLDLEVEFNPSLLAITDVLAGASSPADWDFFWSNPSPGRLIITANGDSPLPAATLLTLFQVVATVPDTASYASKQVLRITTHRFTDQSGFDLPSAAEDAVHIVAFPGDTTANGLISSLDVTSIRRWIGAVDGGFSGFQLADPIVVADFNADGNLTSGDVTQLRRFILELPQAFIPSVPPGVTINPSGLDPRFWLPRTLTAAPGDTIRVPIHFEQTDSRPIDFSAFDLVVSFDTNMFTLMDVVPGDVLPPDEFLVVRRDGLVAISAASIEPRTISPGVTGTLAWLSLRVRDDAVPNATSALNLLDSAPSNQRGQLGTLAGDGRLVLHPAPTNRPDDPVDGLVRIRGRKVLGTTSPITRPPAAFPLLPQESLEPIHIPRPKTVRKTRS